MRRFCSAIPFLFFFCLPALFSGCSSESLTTTTYYTPDHSLAVPVKINRSTSGNFIFDTGIGISVISSTMCEKLNCKITGEFTGQRMSGQSISLPTTNLKSLAINGWRVNDLTVGIFDTETLAPGSGIDGILSLAFFQNVAFTVDDHEQKIVIETVSSLKKIKSTGQSVHAELDVHGPSTDAFIPLEFPGDQLIDVEVDTGSDDLILDEKFMSPLRIDPRQEGVRRVDGEDETHQPYSRYFTRIPGRVQLPHTPQISVDSIDVMFQKIIHDGLVGNKFLREFIVTYDLPEHLIIFRRR